MLWLLCCGLSSALSGIQSDLLNHKIERTTVKGAGKKMEIKIISVGMLSVVYRCIVIVRATSKSGTI